MNKAAAIRLFISIAERDAGKTEVSRNRAPWIKKLWPATTYPEGYNNREPYCAAGLAYVLKTWIEELAQQGELRKTIGMGLKQAEGWRCKSARAFDWRDWAKKKGLHMEPDTGRPESGDIVVFDFSHIGIVTEPSGQTRVDTIEYNTNYSGSRDGDGCWQKSRDNKLAQWFIRLPIIDE